MEDGPKCPVDQDALPVGIAGEGARDAEGLVRLRRLYYIPVLVVVVAIIVAVLLFMDRPTDAKEYVKSSGYTGVLLMAIIGSTSPVWPIPGSVAAFLAGGFGLNPFVLALVAGTGEALGESIIYAAGKGGQPMVAKWKRYRQIEGWTARHGALTIFLTSVIPNFFGKLVTIAAGALHYPWWKFAVLCWSGKTIKDLCFALAGAGLFDIIVHLFD
ncbi:MAG: VTT domain-containing protein [Dehalococcoidia bacterium]